MRNISAGELARMVDVEKSSFNDSCILFHFTGMADSMGEITNTWDSGTAIACGFQEPVAKNARDERGQIVVINVPALLRLPADQSVGVQDKVTVRSATYYVDNVLPGLTVNICELVKDFHGF